MKNIDSIKYFLDKWETVDTSYDYTVPYHKDVDAHFTSLPTFVAEFHDCRVHSCPLLATMHNKLITSYIWGLTHKSKFKPQKAHGLWSDWGDNVDVDLPRVSNHFHEKYHYVWLPIDEDSVGNPWHIWIDVISKFRLIEKRWSTDFTKYCYVLANESKYLEKCIKELFPEVKVLVMPKNETWQFKHLLVPSASNSKDGVITPHLAPWLRHFKGRPELKDVKPHRKIVVLRPGAKTRRITNSDELLLALEGWETVDLAKMTIREQMKTFAEATHIVAAHGAGLVNLLWCTPGTKVIEIQDPKMIHKKVYPVLSHHLGLEHKLYLTDTVPIPLEKDKKPKGIKRLTDLINFKIDIADLMKHID
jgi:hypothetical protein